DLTEREADLVVERLKSMPIVKPSKPKQATAQQPQQQEQDPAARRAHMLALFGQLGITDREDVLRDISIITGTDVNAAAPPSPQQMQDAIDVLEAAGGDLATYDAMVSQIQQARAETATS